MTTQEIIAYIHTKTGRRLLPPALSRYIKEGRLHPTIMTTWRGRANNYTQRDADRLIRYFLSLSKSAAAREMTKRLGYPVSRRLIERLCNADLIIHISDPHRIPADTLDDLESYLRERDNK